MRYEHTVKVRCDICEKLADGKREVMSTGGQEVARVQYPSGWTGNVARPAIAVPRPPQVDPFVPAHELARVTGQPVDAVACGTCSKKLADAQRVEGVALVDRVVAAAEQGHADGLAAQRAAALAAGGGS